MKDLTYIDFFNKKHEHLDILYKNIVDGLTSIYMDEHKISEKNFKEIDNVVKMIKIKIDNNILENADDFLQSGKRMNLYYENLYDNFFNISESLELKYLTPYNLFEGKRNINNKSIEDTIKNLKKLDKTKKDIALKHLKQYTHAKNGKITGLNKTIELNKKIKDSNLPNGFDMGIDSDGFFIHTHRARSKSHEISSDITQKEMRFIDSTG